MPETYQDARTLRPKPQPHPYQPDPTVPEPRQGWPRPCRCGLAKPNGLHDPEKLAAAAEAVHEGQAEERRRTGERED